MEAKKSLIPGQKICENFQTQNTESTPEINYVINNVRSTMLTFFELDATEITLCMYKFIF